MKRTGERESLASRKDAKWRRLRIAECGLQSSNREVRTADWEPSRAVRRNGNENGSTIANVEVRISNCKPSKVVIMSAESQFRDSDIRVSEVYFSDSQSDIRYSSSAFKSAIRYSIFDILPLLSNPQSDIRYSIFFLFNYLTIQQKGYTFCR